MLITLTTDFGTSDWFVGTMKGVISGIAPATRIIDITHKVPPGDLVDGAFALSASSPYFPPGTIHVAVVDPGVGSSRRAITLRTQRAIFIGPDNGVLSWAVREDGITREKDIVIQVTQASGSMTGSVQNLNSNVIAKGNQIAVV